MKLPRIEIVEGEVVKVQLSSETHVAPRAKADLDGDLLVSSKVVNFSRLFLLGSDGKERDFQFANTTVGVREGHKIALVRAKPDGPGPWYNLAIYNFTTEQREEQIGAFAKATRQRWVPARVRAIVWAVLIGLVHWGLATVTDLRGKGFVVAAAVGVLAYPLVWAFFGTIDALVLPGEERAAEKALRKAIDQKMAARLLPSLASPDADIPAGSARAKAKERDLS